MKILSFEFAEKLKFFLQILGNGFNSVCVLSRAQTESHTPKVVFEKRIAGKE